MEAVTGYRSSFGCSSVTFRTFLSLSLALSSSLCLCLVAAVCRAFTDDCFEATEAPSEKYVGATNAAYFDAIKLFLQNDLYARQSPTKWPLFGESWTAVLL